MNSEFNNVPRKDLQRIIPDLYKVRILDVLFKEGEQRTPELYIQKMEAMERDCERRIIETLNDLYISASVKTNPYSLPYSEIVTEIVPGGSCLNEAYDLRFAARIITKELLNKNLYKIRFYLFINISDTDNHYGKIEYQFRYYPHYIKSNNMNDKSEALWLQFKESFKRNVQSLSEDQKALLNSLSDRKYVLKDVFYYVSKDLDLDYKKNEEFLRVDYTLFKIGTAHEWQVPQIFIESENSVDSSYKEVIKLCSLNAPLKVLIHYGLTGEFRAEIEGNETNWDYIFQDFINESWLIGYFALFVYNVEQGGKAVFHTILYGEDGSIIEKGIIPLDR